MSERGKLIIEQMAALGQETRFRVFNYLMKAGRADVSAGRIAEELDILPSTLSSHLAILARVRLVTSTRDGRVLYYAANIDGVRGMIEGIVADCCDGHPELCQSLQSVARFDCRS